MTCSRSCSRDRRSRPFLPAFSHRDHGSRLQKQVTAPLSLCNFVGPPSMAEPKKETVRIALPPRPEQAGSAPGIEERDTARIVLPTRTPVTPIRRPPNIAPLPASEATADQPTILRRPPPANTSPLLQP